MAQQGSPPRRPSRQPDSEHSGRGERTDRSGPDRPRRADRQDRVSRHAYEPFGPEDDTDLPPWATPSSYQERPGGSRLRPAGQRGGRVRDRYADPYADQYAEPARSDGAVRREPAYQDRDGVHRAGGSDGGDVDGAAFEDRAVDGQRYQTDAGGGEGYQGRRRVASTLDRDIDGDAEDTGSDRYELAETDAEPGAEPGRGPRRRRGRAAATRLRKSRRRVYRWSGVAIVIVLLAAGGVWLFGRSTPAPTPWVTRLLAGEYKSVPNACSAVSPTVLNSFLPATGRTQRVSVGSSTDSQCSYTFDKQPTFLVLQIADTALQPFAAAGNNGSATANARQNFAAARQSLAKPPKRSPLPPATIAGLTGLGQQAIIATQHEHVSGIGTDVVTIVTRERNVLITVSVSGQESGHGFGPVPDSTLMACARAVAAGVLAKAETEPTA